MMKVKGPTGIVVNFPDGTDPATIDSAMRDAIAHPQATAGEQSPPPSYDTKLSPVEDMQFRSWKQRFAPNDSGADYDLRGAFKSGLQPDPKTGHWPDTFKKPNHPTFSNESMYAKDRPDLAGSWNGDQYIPPGQQAPAPSWADTGTDVLQSAGAGLVRGATGMAGLPGDIGNLVSRGTNWLGRKAGMDIQPLGPEDMYPGSADVTNWVEQHVTGKLHQPTTTAGKYADTIAEFAPGMLIGSGEASLAGRALKQMVIPGAASEAAGQATGGTAAEPYARLAGAVAGGGIGAIRRPAKLPVGAPIADIKQAADAAFTTSRAGGTTVKAGKVDGIVNDIVGQNRGRFPNPKLYPEAAAVLEETVARRGAPQTIQDLHELRQIMQDSIKGAAKPGDARLVRQMQSVLDRHLDGLKQADVTGGDPAVAVAALREGNQLWGRYMKAKEIDNIFEDAKDKLGANYTQAGEQTAIRQGFRKLSKELRENPHEAAGWTSAERAQIKRVTRGGNLENLLRGVGYFSPRGPVSAFAYGGGTVVAPQITIPLGIATAGARVGSTKMALREASMLDAMVRSGADRPQSRAITRGTPPPKAGLTRLYRGEGNAGFAQTDQTGRWFSNSIEEAKKYAKSNVNLFSGPGPIYYVDVPHEMLGLLKKGHAAPRGVEHYIISPEIAKIRQPFIRGARQLSATQRGALAASLGAPSAFAPWRRLQGQ